MAAWKPQERIRFRFGEFELDTRSGQLLRSGVRVDLQDQPAKALAMLLERPGELVKREELISHLWPGDTFVDFDRGLNKAVAKLRAALADDSERPRFIETVSKRGYRFLAPVHPPVVPADSPGSQPSVPGKLTSIAVLPLDNLSGDPAQEYFSEGMTEELIAALGKIDSLRVISRTSARAYKDARKPLPAIAAELRVDAIVEGSVARSGGKVRVIVQLIDAAEDRHLWSGRYERHLQDVLRLQAEVAIDITRQIRGILQANGAGLPEPVFRPVQPQAYEAFLKGAFFRDKLNPPDLEKSIKFFHQAIDIDPTYARAYGLLARSYLFMAIFGLRHPLEAFRQVRMNGIRALEFDPTLLEGHLAMAPVHIFDRWDWKAATNDTRRALELNPADSFARAQLADLLSIQGHHDEAIAEMARALDVDPISPELNSWIALLHYRARRYSETIEFCHRVMEIDPHHSNALWFRALALEQEGRTQEAIADLELAVDRTGGPHFLGTLGRMLGKLGEKQRALSVLDSLRAMERHAYLSPVDIAMVHLGLGEWNAMFDALEESAQQRAWRTEMLKLPVFDEVREDSRYRSLVKRIGLE